MEGLRWLSKCTGKAGINSITLPPLWGLLNTHQSLQNNWPSSYSQYSQVLETCPQFQTLPMGKGQLCPNPGTHSQHSLSGFENRKQLFTFLKSQVPICIWDPLSFTHPLQAFLKTGLTTLLFRNLRPVLISHRKGFQNWLLNLASRFHWSMFGLKFSHDYHVSCHWEGRTLNLLFGRQESFLYLTANMGTHKQSQTPLQVWYHSLLATLPLSSGQVLWAKLCPL